MKTNFLIISCVCLIICSILALYHGISVRDKQIEELTTQLQLEKRIPPPEITIQIPLNGTNIVYFTTNILIPNVAVFKVIPIQK